MALINVAINFCYEYFCFVIYISEIFLSKLLFKFFFSKFSNIYFSKCFFEYLFFKIFFPKLFLEIFFQIFFLKTFFSKFFLQIFFPKIFFSEIFLFNFFLTIFFPTLKKSFFLRALLSMLPRLQRQNGLHGSVLWKIWFTASRRNWTLVLCDKVLFFGSYCSHRTRPEKFNSFPATHNILLYFFQNLLYLIEVLKCFLDGI